MAPDVGMRVVVVGADMLRVPPVELVCKLLSEKGEVTGKVLLRGVGTLRYCLILSENPACQVPICAVAA